jgi:rubredoxin
MSEEEKGREREGEKPHTAHKKVDDEETLSGT